jgi:hypothetical protein
MERQCSVIFYQTSILRSGFHYPDLINVVLKEKLMAIINVIVGEVKGKKRVSLRDVNRDTFPWTYKTVKEADARDHIEPHSRNCDFETEARGYFNHLKKG